MHQPIQLSFVPAHQGRTSGAIKKNLATHLQDKPVIVNTSLTGMASQGTFLYFQKL